MENCPNNMCKDGIVYVYEGEVFGSPIYRSDVCPVCRGAGDVPIRDLVESFGGDAA